MSALPMEWDYSSTKHADQASGLATPPMNVKAHAIDASSA